MATDPAVCRDLRRGTSGGKSARVAGEPGREAAAKWRCKLAAQTHNAADLKTRIVQAGGSERHLLMKDLINIAKQSHFMLHC